MNQNKIRLKINLWEKIRDISFEKSIEIFKSLYDELLLYIQQKNDFLAEITTEPLMTTVTMNFYRDIILPFQTNIFVMDNLAANEGINYISTIKNRLKIYCIVKSKDYGRQVLVANFKCDDGCEFDIYQYPYIGVCLNHFKSISVKETLVAKHNEEPNSLISAFDPQLEMPGILGKFAIYNILENIIRNAAKHNKDKFDKDPNLDLKIHIEIDRNEQDPNFYIIRIWDNVSEPEKILKIDGSNESKSKVNLIEALNFYKNKEIIESTGELRKENWGIGEIKICSTLLRGSVKYERMSEYVEIKDRIDESDKIPIIKEIVVKNDSKNKDENIPTVSLEYQNKALVYEFKALKTKKYAIFSDNIKLNNQKIEELKGEGIYFYDDFDKLKNEIISGEDEEFTSFKFIVIHNENYHHAEQIFEFLSQQLESLTYRIIWIVPQNDKENWFNHLDSSYKLKEILSKRVHLVGNDDFQLNSALNQNSDETRKRIWEAWLGKWLNGERLRLVLFLEQKINERPTQWWKNTEKIWSEDSLIKLKIAYLKDALVEFKNDTVNRVRSAIFDRHLALGRRRELIPFFFHEVLDKDSPDFLDFFNPMVSPHRRVTKETVYEIAESTLVNVLVIDERIAEKADEEIRFGETTERAKIVYEVNKTESIKRWQVWKKAGIYICTHIDFGDDKEIEIAKRNKAYKVKFKENKIQFFESKNNKFELINDINFDFIIIHQGILDTYIEKIHNLENFIDNIRKYIPFVIIDSGRGIPTNLPKNVKFLPFSALSEFIMRPRIGKHRLTKIIMPLTRRI